MSTIITGHGTSSSFPEQNNASSSSKKIQKQGSTKEVFGIRFNGKKEQTKKVTIPRSSQNYNLSTEWLRGVVNTVKKTTTEKRTKATIGEARAEGKTKTEEARVDKGGELEIQFGGENFPLEQLEGLEKKIEEKLSAGQPQLESIKEKLKDLKEAYQDYKKNENVSHRLLTQKASNILSIVAKLHKLLENLQISHKATTILQEELEEPKIEVIGKGQAKVVVVKEGHESQVYILARNRFKESEINEELETAESINRNLFITNLQSIFENSSIDDKEGIALNLESIFKDPATLTTALKNQVKFKDKLIESGFDEVLSNKILLALSKEDAKKLLNEESNLVLDFQKPGLQGKDATYPKKALARTRRALGDLEKIFRNAPIKLSSKLSQEILKEEFMENANLGLQMLNGMNNLHKAGYLHGDLKIDNLNVFEIQNTANPEKPKKLLRISDFGKTKRMPKTQPDLLYMGNPRNASVEGRLSAQGEVYSAGLVLIRILEESLLKANGTDMISKDVLSAEDRETKFLPDEKRKGIEKFVVLNKHCPQTESNLRGKVKLVGRLLVPKKNYPRAEAEVSKYIDELVTALSQKQVLETQQQNDLTNLLKDMTKTDPKVRPSMKEALSRYAAIFPSQS